jgi:hypothetical protein
MSKTRLTRLAAGVRGRRWTAEVAQQVLAAQEASGESLARFALGRVIQPRVHTAAPQTTLGTTTPARAIAPAFIGSTMGNPISCSFGRVPRTPRRVTRSSPMRSRALLQANGGWFTESRMDSRCARPHSSGRAADPRSTTQRTHLPERNERSARPTRKDGATGACRLPTGSAPSSPAPRSPARKSQRAAARPQPITRSTSRRRSTPAGPGWRGPRSGPRGGWRAACGPLSSSLVRGVVRVDENVRVEEPPLGH